MIKHLHCLFVVIKWERTSVDHRLKTPLSYATMNRYKWVAYGAMHNWINVLIFFWSSRDLTFPDKTLKGVRGEKWQLKKNIWIFLDKLFLDLAISFCFPSLVSFFQRSTAFDCEFTWMISDQIARHEVHVNLCKAQLTK